MAEKQTDKPMQTPNSANTGKGSRIYTGLAVICALLFVAEFFYKKKPGLAIEAIPALHVIVAIVTIGVAVFASHILKKLLSREADYYAPRDVDDEDYPHDQLEREVRHD